MKRNKNLILSCILVSLFSFLVSYYLLNSFVLAFLFTILANGSVIMIFSYKTKDTIKQNHLDNSYNFINMLNVQMLVNKNVYEAYKSIENFIDVDFANIMNEDFHNQLLDIATQYDINGFKMYINTLILYDNDGGDFTKMEEIPSSICQKNKIYINRIKKKKASRLFDVSTLYILWIFVLIFLKSALAEYYNLMCKKIAFSILMLIVLILGLLSYTFACIEFFKNKIRGL